MVFQINYHLTDLENRKDVCEVNLTKKTGCVHINRVLFVCQTYQISPYFKTSSFTETIFTAALVVIILHWDSHGKNIFGHGLFAFLWPLKLNAILQGDVHSSWLTPQPLLFWGWGWNPRLFQKVFLDYPNNSCRTKCNLKLLVV